MAKLCYDSSGRLLFTKEMRKDYTILLPAMAPIHFEILKCTLNNHGYHAVLLSNETRAVVDCGLKYVHNDTCYPALLVIGQMISALESGLYDKHKVALMITQTGGGCRASNYIHLLRKALHKAGLDYVPVISLNVSGLEKNSGFRLTLPFLRQSIGAIVYGDLLMLLSNQTRPYELHQGDSDRLVSKWIAAISDAFNQNKGYSKKEIKANLEKIAADFAAIPVHITPKVKVGVVGEIYVKYSHLGNNNLEALLAQEDCEVMVPGLLNFVMYCMEVHLDDAALYGGGKIESLFVRKLMRYLEDIESAMRTAMKKYPQFHTPFSFRRTKQSAQGIIGYGCKMGEGWLLTAEMASLVEEGIDNIICTQPFGCLPNHVCGKGMIRKLKEQYPNSNIVPIDYDPSATSVNQENRIKLMLVIAKEKLQPAASSAPEAKKTAAAPSSFAANGGM